MKGTQAIEAARGQPGDVRRWPKIPAFSTVPDPTLGRLQAPEIHRTTGPRMVDSCHWREVGVSRSAANNWARGHKTYRCGEVGFVPALDRLAMRQVSPRLLERAVDFVIVHKLDRLARDRPDDVAILLDIRRAGATLVSVSEQIDETPAGTLMHGIVASFAEFYSKNFVGRSPEGA